MRQFAGFGTPRQTNERFKFLLDKGQTGLSTAFDLPTLMGLDSDDPRSLGEVGRLGVAVDTLDDMRELFDGIDLGKRLGVDDHQRPGHRRHGVLPGQRPGPRRRLAASCAARSRTTSSRSSTPRTSSSFRRSRRVRLVCDVIEFCTEHVPQWNTVSISGYHIREAGSTAVQELAFTLADGFHYVDSAWPAAWTSTTSPRGSASSSTPTTTSSRRSPSTAPPACSGPTRCATSYGAKKESVVEAALPRPDGRLLAAGQAAGGEPDPRRLPGAGRGAGRLPVAAHQQHGRDAGPAVGARRHAGPAHAAGAGLRDRA